jgi:FkbM family methyltransferase
MPSVDKPTILLWFRSACGIARSLRVYYGNRRRARAMDRLYSQFIHSGDLVFDVGAHVGNRIASFRRLGARVVAVEPQPALVKVLKLLYGRTPTVTIEAAAIGNRMGIAKLMINIDNPTTSTASPAFIDAARGAAGWEAQRWSTSVNVAMTTLDAMMVRYGTPAFIKIDVEGFEAEALAGLNRRVSALSFEFTTIQRDLAAACVTRCVELGYTRFNAALGETQSLVHASWLDASAIACWLAALPHAANSGDVYAAAG